MLMKQTIVLAATAVLLFILPIIYIIFWRKKTKAHWKPLFFGAIGFVVSARVLELIVHYFCMILDSPVSRAIMGSTLLYVLYGITMAGFFEEVGRWVMFRVFCKKIEKRDDAVMYGIGHGGIEVWTVSLMAIVSYLVIAATNGNGLPQEALTTVMPAVEAFGVGMGVCNIVERILCMGIHISLTIVVFYGARNRKKIYLFLAILLHMLIDTVPALYQRGVVGLPLTEFWLLVCTIPICIFAHRLYNKMENN